MQQFLRTDLNRGLIPLWNPSILCGQPWVGNPQTWLLYPSMFFAKETSPWTFLTVSAALHLILGGLFVYFLARDNQRSRFSSIVAGIVFMLGGYFASKVQFPNMAQAIAYVPIILLLTGRLAVRPTFKNAMLLGFMFGLQLLAAHAQVSVMSLYLAACYGIYRAWPQLRDRNGHWITAALWAFVAGLFAACLDAGQLLPVLELLKHSDRQTLTLGIANRFVLQPNQVTNFFWPTRYGSPFTANFHHQGNYWETACYFGIVPCLLLIYAAVSTFKRKASGTLFWLLIFIISIWLAMGKSGGLYDLVFYLAPAVKAFHDPARMLLGAAVAGPMLAAIGLDSLLLGASNRWLRIVIAGAVIMMTAVDLGLFVRHLYPLMPVTKIEAAIEADAGDSSALASPGHRVMFTPDERATWRYFIDYSNFRINDSTYLPSLLATHTPNIGMLTGLSDAGGYEPEPVQGAVKRYADAYKQHESGDDAGLNKLSVDSVISFQPKSQNHTPNFFGSDERSITTAKFKATQVKIQPEEGCLGVSESNPDLMSVDTPSGTGSRRITIGDTDFPGWHAYSGGQELAITRTKDGLMQVTNPPGEAADRLILRYEPSTWILGLYLTLAALSFALGFTIYTVLSSVRPVR